MQTEETTNAANIATNTLAISPISTSIRADNGIAKLDARGSNPFSIQGIFPDDEKL